MIEVVSIIPSTIHGEDLWACWLFITTGGEPFPLPATAPGSLPKEDLQAYFEANEASLLELAQEKAYSSTAFDQLPVRDLLDAVTFLVLDELNILRDNAGLPERTKAQLKTALTQKLGGQALV